jgi:predicted exporter
LQESGKRAAQVLDYGSPGWYFIVSGTGPEETLEREEQLAARLEEAIAQGNLGSFLGTSVFVPSIKTQKKTYEAMKALLPLVSSQFEYLGFPPEYANSFNHEMNAAATRYCLPGDAHKASDAPAQAGIGNLWIGEQGGNWYSCVMPLHPSVDEATFRAIADEFDFVHFMNKGKDIGHDLDTLTKTMMLFFLASYLVISVIICCVYPRRDSIKICAAPLFLVVTALAVLAVNRIPLGFFSAAALVLVFGLGLDYIFYMVEKKRAETANLTRLAVVLSFVTTFLSFGALALSSFAPTHIFGLTVSAGLSAAFIFAMLLQSRE